MPTLFKALVMLVAAMIEKAFFADPNHRPLPRHLAHFSRNPDAVPHASPCASPAAPEPIGRLRS